MIELKNKRGQLGFSMAEMLIVVAIIGILAGVAFVAVQSHQEGMNQLELDTVAKEIFVAAQNHLTMARNEGYLGLDAEAREKGYLGLDADKFGKQGTEASDGSKPVDYFDVVSLGEGKTESRGVYYVTVSGGSADATIYNLMLPPYALDPTVQGGNYLIRYQPSTGLVLDVFYASPRGRYATELPAYKTLMGLRWDEKKNDRRSAHIGWYGGTGAAELPKGEPLKEPLLEVVNGDKLYARVTDNNTGQHKLALLVTGKISQAQQVFRLEETGGRIGSGSPILVVLDDITTAGMHFAEIGSVNGVAFIPGEDIVVRAVAYNTAQLTNIANSDEKTVNSLFEKADHADGSGETSLPIKAYVNNIRHLENLSYAISNVDYWPASTKFIAAGGTNPSTIAVQAEQTTDIKWEGLFTGTVQICNVRAKADEPAGEGKEGCFVPVNVSANYSVKSSNVPVCINYDGKLHSIDGITVDVEGTASAGLFGDLLNDSNVKDLMLIDFDIKSVKGDAGALAGTLMQDKGLPKNADNEDIPNVSNVAAYNTKVYDTKKGRTATVRASGTGAGNAGGLIGSVKGGKAAIEKSAAALVVSSTGGNAGGLIGTMAGGTLTDCYSGGHTYNGNYFDASGAAIYNVQAATGTAGGLIGVATGMGNVKACYSTCSATGVIAGGFAGTYAGADGAALSNCYATGLVCGTGKDENVTIGSGDENKQYTAVPKDGAFAYTLTGLTAAKVQGCNYYEIINERIERETNTGGSYSYEIIPNRPTSSMIAADTPVYLTAFGKMNNNNAIVVTALDATADAYNVFVGEPGGWSYADPYDKKLMEYYSVKTTVPNGKDEAGKDITKEVVVSSYNLQGIKRLDSSLADDYFVATHYGDWPAPEIFVINTPSTP